ncbi:Uncharacterised protein [Acinetobacter baumannii]|nr:Uncharacterised protein [Acinetobacter baumannii]
MAGLGDHGTGDLGFLDGKIHGAIAVQRADGDHRMLGVEPGDLLDGQGADVLFGFRAVLAADHECTVAGGADAAGDQQRVGDHRQMALARQFAGEQQGGGAGVDEDAVTGPEQAGGVAGDCAFFLGVLVHSRLEGVLVLAAGRQGGPSVEFADQALFGQRGEVAANGFLRGGKGPRQFVHRDPLALAQQFENVAAAFLGAHRVLPWAASWCGDCYRESPGSAWRRWAEGGGARLCAGPAENPTGP